MENIPAFPTDSERQVGPSTYHFTGMTLRDYFAARAHSSLLAANLIDELGCSPSDLAHDAYLHADAMIKERDK